MKHRNIPASDRFPNLGNPRISFHVTVLTLTAAVVLAVVGAVTLVDFLRSKDAAIKSTEQTLRKIETDIADKVSGMLKPVLGIAETAVNLPRADAVPTAEPHPMTPAFLTFLANNPAVSSIYLGFENGTFVQGLNLTPGRTYVAEMLGAGPDARFAVRKIIRDGDGGRVEVVRLLDAAKRPVAEPQRRPAEYDPRERPWYRQALPKSETHITDIYPFANEPSHGMTVARRINEKGRGVLGVDVTLATFSRFLVEEKEQEIGPGNSGLLFAFLGNGQVIAHSEERLAPAQASGSPGGDAGEFPGSEVEKAAFRHFLDQVNREQARQNAGAPMTVIGGAEERVLNLNGREYATRLTRLSLTHQHGAFLASAIPIDPFLQPLLIAHIEGIVISLVLVILLSPLVYLVAISISGPVRSLTHMAKEISTLNPVPEREPLHSFVEEVDDLARALRTAQVAVNSFTKYVPSYVVRQIVDSAHVPGLGGERREVSVLFTDLEGFTRWSQRISPEELMDSMSDYLSGMCGVIEDSGGVVDKFVGDAVLAYWNAPMSVEDHAHKACAATLACRNWINREMLRNAEGAPGEREFYTRFGLHLGDVVCGNVGSENRMDFTILGATINLGSRLEPLNKNYGTQILVSDDVVKRCNDSFAFRWVDTVLPAGANDPMDVYELVAARSGTGLPAELELTSEQERMLEAWAPIRDLYRARKWRGLIAALDAYESEFGPSKLVETHRKRVKRFMNAPPPADWNYATVYLSKR